MQPRAGPGTSAGKRERGETETQKRRMIRYGRLNPRGFSMYPTLRWALQGYRQSRGICGGVSAFGQG
eukprot:4591719-Pyramimonas_sp.AAC.1